MIFRIAIIAATLLVYSESSVRIDPLVNADAGLFRGSRATDGAYSMFLGIPYANVDTDNPFGPSTPMSPFEDVFEAYDDSIVCPQIDELTSQPTGQVDCLNLNVYVPDVASSRNRVPVLVWIHGGGFAMGSSKKSVYGPRFLLKQDIIVVTINYRLGPYGFLCLDTPEIPGNQGLKDQLEALRWIRNNIEAFGGDVNKITIYGESAGSVSVDFHLYYSRENLFNRAILSSGNSLAYWSTEQENSEVLLKITNHLGFVTENLKEALTFLAASDPKLVAAAMDDLHLRLSPCVEKQFDNVPTFISDYPINANISSLKNIDIIIGFNDDEGGDFHLRDLSNIIKNILETEFNFPDEIYANDMINLVRRFYIGDNDMDVAIEGVERGLVDFVSDFHQVHPAQRGIAKYLANGAENVYQYMVSYVGQRNVFKQMHNDSFGGTWHFDELGYVFDYNGISTNITVEDQLMIDRITSLWGNFVKYGNPTPTTSDLLPVTWNPVTKANNYYLQIGTELQLKRRPFHERTSFWDLFYLLNTEFIKGYTPA